MARKKTTHESLSHKQEIARRLREIRIETFGERGGMAMARRIGIPPRSLYNYELGVTMPAEVVLKVLDVTGVEPRWMLRGEGPKYRDQPVEAAPTPVDAACPNSFPPAERLGDALARLLEHGEIRITWMRRGGGSSSG